MQQLAAATWGLASGGLRKKFEMKGKINNFTKSLAEWDSFTPDRRQAVERYIQF